MLMLSGGSTYGPGLIVVLFSASLISSSSSGYTLLLTSASVKVSDEWSAFCARSETVYVPLHIELFKLVFNPNARKLSRVLTRRRPTPMFAAMVFPVEHSRFRYGYDRSVSL